MSVVLILLPNQRKNSEMIRKISDEYQPIRIRLITTNNSITIEKKAITNILAEIFSASFTKENCKQQFLTTKKSAKKCKLKFDTGNLEKYNILFSSSELDNEFQNFHNKVTVPNEIHNEFLKHLKHH